MALSDLDVKARYTANGSNTDFAIPGTVLVSDSSEIKVYTRDETVTPPLETLKVEGTDYTLVGASPPGTPFDTTVRFNTAPTSGLIVVVYHLMPLTQTLDLVDNTNFNMSSLELALDRIVKQVQQIDERVQRALKFQLTSSYSDIDVGTPVATYVLRMNAANTKAEWVAPETVGDSGSFTAHLAATVFGTETQATITNNQAAATAISGVAVAESSWRAFELKYVLERRTASLSYRQYGRLIGTYDALAATWSIADIVDFGSSGPTSGVTFSIDNTGQVYYSSDDVTGATYVGNMRYIFIYKFTKET